MNNAEMKKVFIKASIFTGVCMVMMLQRASTKHILITDAAGTEIDRSFSEESYNLLIDKNVKGSQEGKLTIPLPKSVSSDDIVLEDRYTDHELLIYVDGREESFYLDNPVVTDLDIINEAVCVTENDSGSVCLDFKLDGLYANESSLTESSTIEVRFFKPYDEYDQIVVVDPVWHEKQDSLEKDLTLEIALSIKNTAEKADDHRTKFYYTRLTEADASVEKRKALIEESGADLVAIIDTEDKDSSDGVSAYYNGEFFLRKYTNADFAGLLAASGVSRTGADVVGVYEAENDEILSFCQIPAAKVVVGGTEGEQDQNQLYDKTYRNKLAEGLYQGIMQGFEEIR